MTDDPQAPLEPFVYSSRLLFTYCAAAIAFVAAGKSGWIALVATTAWVVMTARMVMRFRLRAVWAMFGAPFAFYWIWLITRPSALRMEVV